MVDLCLLERFLNKVDKTFPVALSDKQDLHVFAHKLADKATLCVEYSNDEIVSMVAGYTDNLPDDKAYISVVATAPEGRGRGLASGLVKEFISVCKDKNINAVHLYTDSSNTGAIRMYEKIGFVPYIVQDEIRPDDVHLIYYIAK